jgi:MFS family permease
MTGTNAATSAGSLRKVIVASLIGTSLEWYDFFLYSTAAAVVFNRLFFPNVSPVTGTLLAFTTAAVGFVARPVGGIIFGHLGDRRGRKQVLVITLLTMGVATVLIGALPTYASIGVAAPVLLALLRFVQGLALGGEWGGAVLMTLEHGAAGRRGFNASWAQVGVPMGNLLAAGALGVLGAVMSEDAFLSWGWRLPFFFSGLLVLAGLWIRLTVAESPLFAEVERAGAKAKMPLLEVLRRHPRELLVAMAARIGTDVAFYTFTVYSLVFITGTVGRERSVGLTAVLVGSAFQLVLIPSFGALSDRFGRRPVYAAGAVAAAAWSFAFFPLLSTGSTTVIVLAVVVALLTHAAMWTAGRVHRRALRHRASLQRSVDGLSARRGLRRRHRADRGDLAGRRLRHRLRRVGVCARHGDADAGGARGDARNLRAVASTGLAVGWRSDPMSSPVHGSRRHRRHEARREEDADPSSPPSRPGSGPRAGACVPPRMRVLHPP